MAGPCQSGLCVQAGESSEPLCPRCFCVETSPRARSRVTSASMAGCFSGAGRGAHRCESRSGSPHQFCDLLRQPVPTVTGSPLATLTAPETPDAHRAANAAPASCCRHEVAQLAARADLGGLAGAHGGDERCDEAGGVFPGAEEVGIGAPTQTTARARERRRIEGGSRQPWPRRRGTVGQWDRFPDAKPCCCAFS